MPAMFLPLCSDISWSIFAVSDMFGDGCSAKDHFEMSNVVEYLKRDQKGFSGPSNGDTERLLLVERTVGSRQKTFQSRAFLLMLCTRHDQIRPRLPKQPCPSLSALNLHSFCNMLGKTGPWVDLGRFSEADIASIGGRRTQRQLKAFKFVKLCEASTFRGSVRHRKRKV